MIFKGIKNRGLLVILLPDVSPASVAGIFRGHRPHNESGSDHHARDDITSAVYNDVNREHTLSHNIAQLDQSESISNDPDAGESATSNNYPDMGQPRIANSNRVGDTTLYNMQSHQADCSSDCQRDHS